MADVIVYTAENYGMDGRDKRSIAFASFIKAERDKWLEDNPNRAYYSENKFIADTVSDHRQALSKLNGLDRLFLELPQRPSNKKQ